MPLDMENWILRVDEKFGVTVELVVLYHGGLGERDPIHSPHHRFILGYRPQMEHYSVHLGKMNT